MSALEDAGEGPVVERLAAALVAAAGHSTHNLGVEAGYTYFGQFVDHDVTGTEATRAKPSPLLDLDSLYGLGPRPGSPLYGHGPGRLHGVRLRLGGRPNGESGLAREDLPRDDSGRALIGDTRNDENLIIAQLHLLFIRFHNRVVDRIAAPGMPVIRVFHEARRLVRWHYQWLIVNDFLPKLVGDDAVAAAPAARVAVTTVAPEFAAAVYRFGHSMVREDYRLNDRPAVPLLHPRGEDQALTLAGNRPLPARMVIDWERFFRTGARSPQRSMRIDASLTTQFGAMPAVPGKPSLALLDLLQGIEDHLPTGTALTAGTPEALRADELLGRLGDDIDDGLRRLVLDRTPLWYFVLCEAEARGGGKRLGPLGARIVADQLIGLLHGDEESYLSVRPDWSPAGVLRRRFATVADFVEYAQGR